MLRRQSELENEDVHDLSIKRFRDIIIIIIITGTTVLCEPWPSSKLFTIPPYIGLPGYPFFGFLNNLIFMV
jgi:hypothetical protein